MSHLDTPQFEPLEQRAMLSLIGVAPESPFIAYNSTGRIGYSATTKNFDLAATPTGYFDAANPNAQLIWGQSVQIHIQVDNDGSLLGGVSGDDLVVEGLVDFDGDFVPDATGVLLTGQVVGFGYKDAGTTDLFDFVFIVTGGSLANTYSSGVVGVTCTAENSTFAGGFQADFVSRAKGNIGPITIIEPPAPAIDIEKFVQATTLSGGEGLTPGYWKQPQHFDDWTGFSPGDKFNDVFGVNDTPGMTLLDALKRGGGGKAALGRHAVAALLNAAHPNIAYKYSVQQVIQMVRDAYASGNFEAVKNRLAEQNELEGDIRSGGKGAVAGPSIDADDAPGLVVSVGDTLTFSYFVSNPGDTPLANVTVIDDNATPALPGDDFSPAPILAGGYNVGDIDQDGLLDPGETWLYAATAVAKQGQFTNIAMASATPVDNSGQPVADDVADGDTANYFAGPAQSPPPSDCPPGGKPADKPKQSCDDKGHSVKPGDGQGGGNQFMGCDVLDLLSELAKPGGAGKGSSGKK